MDGGNVYAPKAPLLTKEGRPQAGVVLSNLKPETLNLKPSATARWVLNHQFLRIDMDDDKTPSEYEATVFIGWDGVEKRYVVHCIDVFGRGFSKTLGYGTRDGSNKIEFHFAYPNGPFATPSPSRKKNSWTSVMQSRNPDGTWRLFGENQSS